MAIDDAVTDDISGEHIIFKAADNRRKVVIVSQFEGNDFAVLADDKRNEHWVGFACDRVTMAHIAYQWRGHARGDMLLNVAVKFFSTYFTDAEWTLAALECF